MVTKNCYQSDTGKGASFGTSRRSQWVNLALGGNAQYQEMSRPTVERGSTNHIRALHVGSDLVEFRSTVDVLLFSLACSFYGFSAIKFE